MIIEKDILIILKSIQKDIFEIRAAILQNTRENPLPAGYNPMRKNKCLSQRLYGGLMDPEIRAAIMRLRSEGKRFKDIEIFIKTNWPDHPGKHVSRSAIHRFCQSARNGRLREFGISPFFTEPL